MHRGWYIILSISLTIIIALLYNVLFTNQVDSTHTADNGRLNLNEVKLADNVIPLNGEWVFYDSIFLPEQSDAADSRYMKVPGSWGKQDYFRLNTGYGTYQLTIQLHKEQVGETLGLYIPNAATAYEVWIDGKKRLANGTIGRSAKEMIPANYARTLYFTPKNTQVDLVMLVSNFSQRKGGLWDTIHLGTADAISFANEKKIVMQLLVVGALVMMSIYLLIIYFLRKSQRSAFYLGVLTLLIAVRTLLVGETLFIRIFPMFPWEFQVKLEYVTFILGIPLFIRYIHQLYPKDRWPKVQIGVDIVSFLFMSVIILTSALFYTRYLIIYQLLVLPTVLYFIYLFTKAMIRQRPTSRFNFICLLVFMAACLNDVLFYLNFVNTGEFASKGFFIFLVCQTWVHGIKYSDAFHHIENLSSELKLLNQSLEQKVGERTRDLKHANTRLLQVEHSRKALISDISHELSGPLTLIEGYAEMIINDKIPYEQKYWHIVYEKSRVLKRLVHDLSSLSELESRKIRMEFQAMEATNFPKRIFVHFQGELEAGGYELEWIPDDKWAKALPTGAIVITDWDRIHQVFMNVIYNALKYSGEVKKIAMAVKWLPVSDENGNRDSQKIGDLIMQVIDYGSGIAADELPHIFKRLYRGSTESEVDKESRGLGLAISKEIMDIHDGAIWAESNVERGSIFYISLPIYLDKIDSDTF